MSRFYVLRGREVVPAGDDFLSWSLFFETADCQVRVDRIGKVKVSTVFLGLDLRHGAKGPPKLFETLVFGGALGGHLERCSTWAEAEEQHAYVLKRVRNAIRLARGPKTRAKAGS